MPRIRDARCYPWIPLASTRWCGASCLAGSTSAHSPAAASSHCPGCPTSTAGALAGGPCQPPPPGDRPHYPSATSRLVTTAASRGTQASPKRHIRLSLERTTPVRLASGRPPGARAAGSVLLAAAIAAGVMAGATGTAPASATSVIHLPAGQHPEPARAGTGAATAYVLSVNSLTGISGKVTPVVTATNKTLPPIVAKGVPAAIAITPDGKTAYIAYNSGTVIPIRTATNKTLRPIKVG